MILLSLNDFFIKMFLKDKLESSVRPRRICGLFGFLQENKTLVACLVGSGPNIISIDRPTDVGHQGRDSNQLQIFQHS